ncbi:6082_t:CDS:2 [Gigaspora rosea]|nr:6082_t:CDS:2 [Gigaspora rosea]
MSTSGELRALIDLGKIKWYNYGHFSDITKIKEGGYGEVYSATCIPEGKTIALKKLLTKLDSNKKTSKEFVKEVQLLHKVDHHPYINKLLGITQVDDIVSNIKSEAVKKFNENIIKVEQRTNNSSEPVAIIANLSQESRSQINEVEIFSNVKSGTDKKFDNYIFKTQNIRQLESSYETNKKKRKASNMLGDNDDFDYFSGSNIIIAKLSQEFIELYIKDMVTNSDDTANDVNSWLKNNNENSKKIFDFTMNFKAEHHEAILAYFYMKGFGTNKDYKECLQWCKKGCEKKDIYAYYELAFCYRDSLGTFEDYNKAFHYFNLAASGGVLKAKRELAIMYMDGMGCEENKNKAFCLFKEAGEQDKMACYIISDCYFDGIGTEKNLVEALKYYKICWKKWEYPNAKIRIPLIEKILTRTSIQIAVLEKIQKSTNYFRLMSVYMLVQVNIWAWVQAFKSKYELKEFKP